MSVRLGLLSISIVTLLVTACERHQTTAAVGPHVDTRSGGDSTPPRVPSKEPDIDPTDDFEDDKVSPEMEPEQLPGGDVLYKKKPLSPGATDCLEMYSACSGEPRRCTSAPLTVDCGKRARVPGTSRWVECVCR
ncbi:MAG: hypothetical protein RL701_1465 [Pseudomonadota bacterium]